MAGLTTDEIIKRARAHFGEKDELSVLDTVLREWVNDAIKDLYDQLPPTELRALISTDPLTLASGSADIPDDWDRVVEIRDDTGVPLHAVIPEVIRAIDLGHYFMPAQTVYSITLKNVLVRPDTVASVQVDHQEPPALIDPANSDQDIETLTGVHSRWHNALVLRLTTYMYQQEEDLESAQSYLAQWQALVQAAWEQSGFAQPAEVRAGVRPRRRPRQEA